ncbi:hypothetical protein V6N13_080648 [Hibiscus sabdariffa]|uniref:Uncharacterized protein n=2 Tax=Hibiscus sabdariffa TaxID=183260 RepID=A0ABR2ABC6_9ROSI
MEKQSKSSYVVVLPSTNEDPEEFVFIEEDDDLSHWEFIHSSDSDAADDNSCVPPPPFPDLRFTSPRIIPIPEMIPDGDDHVPYDEAYTGDQEEEEEEEEEDEDEDELDDELIPRGVSGKLGRQRMRKIGKRGFAKMNNSKRSAMLYVKPGCVHGKHGLGLKHCF